MASKTDIRRGLTNPAFLFGAFALVTTLALAVILLLSAFAAPGDTEADRVFGQGGSFTSNTCNLGGVSASSLCGGFAGVTVGGAGLDCADHRDHQHRVQQPRPHLA